MHTCIKTYKHQASFEDGLLDVTTILAGEIVDATWQPLSRTSRVVTKDGWTLTISRQDFDDHFEPTRRQNKCEICGATGVFLHFGLAAEKWACSSINCMTDEGGPWLDKEETLHRWGSHEDYVLHLQEQVQVLRDLVSAMQTDGTICRDHYNPCRGDCQEQHTWCKALKRLDEIQGNICVTD